MFKKLIFLVILVFVSIPVFAQDVDTAWVRSDTGTSIAIDVSGNVCITGTGGTVKYDSKGSTLWSSSWSGKSVAVDSSGNAYVTDTSGTAKFNTDGIQLWTGLWGGVEIAIDYSGNTYVTGSIFDPLTNSDYLTIKYYPNGDTAWVRRYNGLPNSYGEPYDYATGIALDSSENVYVTGYSNGLTDNYQYTTIKYLPNGDTAWARKCDGEEPYWDDYPYDIAVDGMGNAYVTGRAEEDGFEGYDYVTLKYYPNGVLAWRDIFWDCWRVDQIARSIALDKLGNVYVTGEVNPSELPFPCYLENERDYGTVKYYNNGSFAWERRYNGPENSMDLAYDIATDNIGNVYVTGSSGTVKYDTQGNQKWVMSWPSLAIVADDIGNVYVTGSGKTIKYWQNYPPGSFSLLSPSDSDTLPYVLDFNWCDAIDPDPWDEVKYCLYISTSLSFDPDSTIIYDSLLTTQYTDTLQWGIYYWKVRAYDKHSEVWSNEVWTFLSALYGDANGDMNVSISDAVYLINFLFKSGPPPDPLESADVNCDSYVTVSDIVYLINYLFKGGPAPGC